MLQNNRRFAMVDNLLVIISIAFILGSCSSYNFSHPQPYDKENIYQFPDAFLGKWIGEEDTATYDFDFTVPLNQKSGDSYRDENNAGNKSRTIDDNDSAFYIIYSDYVLFVFYQKEKVLAGEWPKLDSKNKLVYPPSGFRSKKEIKYDSLNHPVDTINNYIINKDKIYEIDADHLLSKGYDFTRENDTLTITKKDSVFIELGQNAFLRKIADSLDAFNINNSVIARGEYENWWMLIILEMNADGKLSQWDCSSKTGELSCMFYDLHPSKYSDIYYFDCQWSSNDLRRLMKEGYFEKTSLKKISE